MNRAETLPFRTSSEFPGVLGTWHHIPPDGLAVYLDGWIPGWDHVYQIQFHRKIRLNAAEFRRLCGLDASAALEVAVVAACEDAPYRECKYDSGPIHSDEFEATIEIDLNSGDLAGSLTLSLCVLLASEQSDGQLFVARRKGSRLFSEQYRVALEGSAARLPIDEVDFEEALGHLRAAAAAWYIAVNQTEADASVGRSVRVFLNSRRPDVVDAVARKDQTVLSLLKADIGRSLIEILIDQDDFELRADRYPDDSIGMSANLLLSVMFPNSDLATIRAAREQEPGRFNALIQSVVAPPPPAE